MITSHPRNPDRNQTKYDELWTISLYVWSVQELSRKLEIMSEIDRPCQTVLIKLIWIKFCASAYVIYTYACLCVFAAILLMFYSVKHIFMKFNN